MKIKLSNEFSEGDMDNVIRNPQPSRLRKTVDIAKNIGMGAVGAGAAVVDGLAHIKPRTDIRSL